MVEHDEPLRSPFADIMDRMANEVARKLAADQDALIRRVITARIGEGWALEAVLPRLRWEQERGKPEKMLILDDAPLLLIWPPDHDLASDELDAAHYMRWVVRYQEMP